MFLHNCQKPSTIGTVIYCEQLVVILPLSAKLVSQLISKLVTYVCYFIEMKAQIRDYLGPSGSISMCLYLRYFLTLITEHCSKLQNWIQNCRQSYRRIVSNIVLLDGGKTIYHLCTRLWFGNLGTTLQLLFNSCRTVRIQPTSMFPHIQYTKLVV